MNSCIYAQLEKFPGTISRGRIPQDAVCNSVLSNMKTSAENLYVVYSYSSGFYIHALYMYFLAHDIHDRLHLSGHTVSSHPDRHCQSYLRLCH